jgi:dethiobiotin synthetase
MRIAVVATGTDVGKTHVTCALLAHLRTSSIPALGWKPVCSGGVQDAQLHARAAGEFIEPMYALARPVSPHLAAREQGVTIDLERIRARALELERRAGVLVVEGAGGLFSPLGTTLTNADLAAIAQNVILVAPDRLGVLHDVTACVRASDIPFSVVLSAPAHADASTGTNAIELGRLGIARVTATFPRAPWDAPESLAQAEIVWRSLCA